MSDASRTGGPGSVVSIGGPVEEVDGRLVLRIPLEAGGRELVDCTRGIGEIEDDCLVVTIPDWLARKLGLFPGSRVVVDNEDDRFRIRENDPEA